MAPGYSRYNPTMAWIGPTAVMSSTIVGPRLFGFSPTDNNTSWSFGISGGSTFVVYNATTTWDFVNPLTLAKAWDDGTFTGYAGSITITPVTT